MNFNIDEYPKLRLTDVLNDLENTLLKKASDLYKYNELIIVMPEWYSKQYVEYITQSKIDNIEKV